MDNDLHGCNKICSQKQLLCGDKLGASDVGLKGITR
jgi:hypothetical protein